MNNRPTLEKYRKRNQKLWEDNKRIMNKFLHHHDDEVIKLKYILSYMKMLSDNKKEIGILTDVINTLGGEE